jgi:excisionase family DNA binding protein
MEPEILTVYEAARRLGCSSAWVRVMLAEQRLMGAKKVDGLWQIPASALEELKPRQAAVAQ